MVYKQLKFGDKVKVQMDDNYQRTYMKNGIVKKVMVEVEFDDNK